MTTREQLEFFLRNLAVQSYNYQFGTQFQTEDFELDIIHANTDSDIAYDVSAILDHGKYRLRVYLYVGDRDAINQFIPTLDDTFAVGELGDEIMMANGVLDTIHIRNDGWNIKAFIEENRISRGIIAKDGVYLTTEDEIVLIREEE
jgi:hypothetical protein